MVKNCLVCEHTWDVLVLWLDIICPMLDTIDYYLLWVENLQITKTKKMALDVIIETMWWAVCRYQNSLVFGEKR